MSLDIILWAPSKAALATWAQTHPANEPLMTADGPREGVSYCWWAGDGQFKTQNGTYDQDGNEITPPTFAPGVVALLRLHTSFFDNDKLAERTDDQGNAREQWEYSRAAQWIKNNGTPGTMGTVNYYEVDGVRLFRPLDVEAFLAANDLPGHVWVDGNSY
jgi:hypothetical protein